MTFIDVPGTTIDGVPTSEWLADQKWLADHDAHKSEPFWCDQCFADPANHVPFDSGSAKHGADEFDADTCETCWLATK